MTFKTVFVLCAGALAACSDDGPREDNDLQAVECDNIITTVSLEEGAFGRDGASLTAAMAAADVKAHWQTEAGGEVDLNVAGEIADPNITVVTPGDGADPLLCKPYAKVGVQVSLSTADDALDVTEGANVTWTEDLAGGLRTEFTIPAVYVQAIARPAGADEALKGADVTLGWVSDTSWGRVFARFEGDDGATAWSGSEELLTWNPSLEVSQDGAAIGL